MNPTHNTDSSKSATSRTYVFAIEDDRVLVVFCRDYDVRFEEVGNFFPGDESVPEGLDKSAG